MTTLTHEQTINTSLGEVLQDFGQGWTIRSEHVGKVFEEGGRPDILIEKSDGWPVVLEAEVGNHRQAEIEAQQRLGNRLVSSANTVHAAIALVYPDDLRRHHGAQLRDALRDTNLEYALFTVEADGSTSRFPAEGWVSGQVSELAVLLHRSSIPAWRVEALADELERGVIRAAGAFSATHAHGSALGQSIAELLGQEDDEAGQTRRMAMTVIVNALVFHAALSEAEMEVPSTPPRSVRNPSEARSHGSFLPSQLLDEWDLILEVNYWPIFHTAGEIVRIMPSRVAATILDILWETTEELVVGGVTKSHDLTGVVFQRLIADRKFLATYYTRPSGAALLAGLAMPIQSPISGAGWGDAGALSAVRIGDFACGTGTLLSTAYQRISLLHEIHGGDPKAIHPQMMESGLVGLDVLTVAVHLTAAMLAGSHPDTPFAGECLLTMPYGRYDWGVCVGSLDLLEAQTSFEIIQAAAQTAGGRGTTEVRDLVQQVGHNQFELVIMNPPFVRHGAREGDRTEVHNPAFAAFGATEEEQDQLSSHLRRLGRDGNSHGHAGHATYFVDLAHRKLAVSGTLALVLPLTALSGQSWHKVRTLWRDNYSSIIVVTIAGEGSHARSFSADTGMAECLIVAKKERASTAERRAIFIVLNNQPQDTLQGEQIAQVVSQAIADGNIRRLEDGPLGGTRILIGNTFHGEALSCPIPTSGAWQMVGIKDVTLAQTAHQMTQGRLWVEGMPAREAIELPIASVGDVSTRIGPHHLDLSGAQIKGDGLPQGPFEVISGLPDGAAYPCLWKHQTADERQLIVQPDSHCRVREVDGRTPDDLQDRALARWETARRLHYNLDLQFNSQSLVACMTEHPSIGGRAWPTVILADDLHEYAFALWSNSTPGFMCRWWMSNKTQAGRGTSTVTSIPGFTTLDVQRLSADQHQAAREAFDALADERFLPFDQINEDAARAELDRRLLTDVLGLSPDLCAAGGPMERLRAKLAAEPQIHSDKRTRVVFTDEGETTAPR